MNGRQFGVELSASRSAPVSSYRLTMVTSEVSLKMPMKLFTIAGTTSAQRLRQHDLALRLPVGQAERLPPPRPGPCGIACRPPRTTSAR